MFNVGVLVEVDGNLQSNGTVTASRVHREDESPYGDGDGSDVRNGRDTGSSGSDSSATGGSDH